MKTDIIMGKYYGRCKVVERIGKTDSYIVACDCGAVVKRSGHSLRNGKNGPCNACSKPERFNKINEAKKEASDVQYEELIGKKFGKWTVVRICGPKIKRGVILECVCDCGTVRERAATLIINGKSSMCSLCGMAGTRKRAMALARMGKGSEKEFTETSPINNYNTRGSFKK